VVRRCTPFRHTLAFENQYLVLTCDPNGILKPGAAPEQYLPTPARQTPGRFAPGHNERWLAYFSDESGRQEVYVQSFPAKGEKLRISDQGGVAPIWGSNARSDSTLGGSPYDTIDGQRFLILAPVALPNRPLQVIDNWPALLKH
jgi:hypothetical protein